MKDDPVVLLEGPRSVGKSTLLREIAAETGAEVIDLDAPEVRAVFESDPGAFIPAGGNHPICVDEYQKVPMVLDVIKSTLNRGPSSDRYLLTGSTRHDSLPPAAQALTGRLTTLTVYPLSQGEIDGTAETFLGRLFEDPDAVVEARRVSSERRQDYIERIVAGGFPLALVRSEATSRNRWFDNYVKLTLERDVRELSRIRQGDQLERLLHTLAGQTAQVLNLRRAAEKAGLDPETAENYLRLLEAVFLVYRLPAWGKTLRARASRKPKIHVLDSGLAARLLRLTPEKLGRKEAASLTEFGHLLETFAVGEMVKQASWLDRVTGYGHWRTHDQDEVDFVAELDDGSVVAVEVKAGGRIDPRDLGALRKLRAALGDSLKAAVVLYTGERSYRIEDRIHAMPVDQLWAP